MSRSRRRTPITGWTTAESEKEDKRRANRAFRAAAKEAIRRSEEPPHHIRCVSEVYSWAKDGKTWLGDRHPNLMRK
jgi:hypothetical protein